MQSPGKTVAERTQGRSLFKVPSWEGMKGIKGDGMRELVFYPPFSLKLRDGPDRFKIPGQGLPRGVREEREAARLSRKATHSLDL